MKGWRVLVPGGAALVLGMLILAARRENSPEKGARPRRPAALRPAETPAPERQDNSGPAIPTEALAPRAPAAPGVPPSPDAAAIQSRVLALEGRLRDLEGRREELSTANKELERQVSEKLAESSARMMAEVRVKGWETLLGLSETQKRNLIDLLTPWGKQDALRPADLDAWMARETELRSYLTAEQAAKLGQYATSQSQAWWGSMGRSLGTLIGAGKDEQVRLQQSLGDYRPPANLLLPEAHASDWNGLMREAVGRLRPVLTQDETVRLDRMGWK